MTWGGEEIAIRSDASSGAWMLVGLHSTALGPAMGGTRVKPYPSVDAALQDVLRLSRAMTMKNALAGLPFGGGKAVIAIAGSPAGDDRRSLMLRYGDLVDSLDGRYVTACDMNTTELDMDVVATRTSHVLGRSVAAGGSGSSAPDTAKGVFHAIRATCRHVFGSDDLSERKIAIQGAGAVGEWLARLLVEAGALVSVADVNVARAEAVAGEAGATMVGADEIASLACDVYSPCATGGVLSADTTPALACGRSSEPRTTSWGTTRTRAGCKTAGSSTHRTTSPTPAACCTWRATSG